MYNQLLQSGELFFSPFDRRVLTVAVDFVIVLEIVELQVLSKTDLTPVYKSLSLSDIVTQNCFSIDAYWWLCASSESWCTDVSINIACVNTKLFCSKNELRSLQCFALSSHVHVYARDRGIMRLCARIISRIIGDLPRNWANPA